MDYYIEKKINNTINYIFKDYDINTLSFYEKRKMIFDYLVNNLKYDYELLEKIRNFKVNRVNVRRDPLDELVNVIDDGIGICSSISQYYKLLLEKVCIKSYCVICDDGTEVKHQLNLVYDSENDVYSFDDISNVILGKGTVDDFYDYDFNFAISIGQGNKILMNGQRFVILPEEWINKIVKRKNGLYKSLQVLPDNVVSVKNILKGKKTKL